jgi:hypothetical protein
VTESNLFHMLSSYRPGTPATPFDTYCTQGLAYFLVHGPERLLHRFLGSAGHTEAGIDEVVVQPSIHGLHADLSVALDDGTLILVEVQTEVAASTSHLDAIEAATGGDDKIDLLLLGIDESALRPGWSLMTWRTVAEVLERAGDPLARQFGRFVQQDILGSGPVGLREALTTNRFYALAAAAIRRRFGDRAQVTSTASPPRGDRYRYFGTSFALDGRQATNWVGLVNETIPLGEHYDLMLASKDRDLREPSPRPRTTAEWKWPNWTTGGRVVRPIEADDLDRLLKRFPD